MSKETMGTGGTHRQTRRDFLKIATGGAVVTAGIVALGMPEKSYAAGRPGEPEKWDYETDVVVVGYGGAGSIATICAAEDGADVITLESAPIEGGGTTRMSGAYFITCGDPSAAREYMTAQCAGTTSEEVIEAWAEAISGTRDWLTNHRIPWAPSNRGHVLSNPPGGERNEPFSGADFPNLPGADKMDTNEIAGRGGGLFKMTTMLIDNLENAQVLFGTRGKELIQDTSTKEILGIKAEQDDGEIYIKARRGIILATGGFSHNADIMARFMRPDSGFVSLENQYNVGDGLIMSMKAGASLCHMTMAAGSWPTFKTAASEIGWMNKIDASLKAKSWLWTNAVGERWVCETPMANPHRQWLIYGDIDWTQSADNSGYTNIPNWLIFDESVRAAGPLVPPTYTDGLTTIPAELGGVPEKWSEDNMKEIEEGEIIRADTIEELGKKIGERIVPEKLVAAVERFNSFCEAGNGDLDFGRTSENMASISTPPYYAIKLSPALYNTMGGPEKNGKGQVIDAGGNPIPHLFVAGTVAHTNGHLYTMFGANICENFAFGRIAGQAAAATEPWE